MILILGLGSYPAGSGSAAAWYLSKQGLPLVVTDLKSASQFHQASLRKLRRRNIQLVLGRHRRQDIAQAEYIVRNPAVSDDSPYVMYGHQLGKRFTNDVGLFLEALRKKFTEAEVPVIAVTGTRGKSTTTSLITKVLQAQYGEQRVHCGGNIGKSPLTFLHHIRAGDVVVLELSSWLLRDLHQPRFTVAVITNVLRDHMNYYPSMVLYQRDKQRIFLGQDRTHFAVVNQHDSRVRRLVKKTSAHIQWFGRKKITGSHLRGEHNQYNIGAAWAVGRLFGVPDSVMIRAIRQFPGLPHRLELVRRYRGRSFYNDTTATTPDATIAALRSFQRQVILIAGGNSKRLSLRDLKREIPRRVKTLIVLPGNATHEFPPGIEVDTMHQAVHTAWNMSIPGDIVLLSPGVTWLPSMNEFERGRKFVQAVQRLR